MEQGSDPCCYRLRTESLKPKNVIYAARLLVCCSKTCTLNGGCTGTTATANINDCETNSIERTNRIEETLLSKANLQQPHVCSYQVNSAARHNPPQQNTSTHMKDTGCAVLSQCLRPPLSPLLSLHVDPLPKAPATPYLFPWQDLDG